MKALLLTTLIAVASCTSQPARKELTDQEHIDSANRAFTRYLAESRVENMRLYDSLMKESRARLDKKIHETDSLVNILISRQKAH